MGLEITLYRADQCKDFYNWLLPSYAWHVFLVYDIMPPGILRQQWQYKSLTVVFKSNNYNLLELKNTRGFPLPVMLMLLS